MKRILISFSILALGFLNARAGDPKKGAKKEVKFSDLTLTLRNNKDAYKLDLAGKTLKEWEQMLDIGKKLGTPPPKPPVVDMSLEIKNTSDKAVDFWSAGDPVRVVLDLKGPKARTINAPLAFTADFRLPKFTTLEPGKSFVIPIKNLQSGFRGIGTWHYWLAPGEYTITPRLKTGVRPIPPGVREMYDAGAVTLVGKPLSVKVVD